MDRPDTEKLVSYHGRYRDLKWYQMAEIIFDRVVVFCERIVDKGSRTHDQIMLAAR